MAKINIKYKIKNFKEEIEKNCIGIFNNNKIIYKDNEKTTIDIKNFQIIRENEEYTININIKKEEANIIIEEGCIQLDIQVLKYNLEKNKIYLEYILNDEKYIYELEYEVI